MIDVLIADDNPLVLAGLGEQLATEPDLRVVGLARDGVEAVELAAATSPTVVLMDLSMPLLDGVSATRRITDVCPGTRVLVLTVSTSRAQVDAARDAGASGYVVKTGSAEGLASAIRRCALLVGAAPTEGPWPVR